MNADAASPLRPRSASPTSARAARGIGGGREWPLGPVPWMPSWAHHDIEPLDNHGIDDIDDR